MFEHAESLTTLDLSNWEVSNVKNMGHMFEYCTNLKILDLGNWNTKNLESMY